MLKKYYKFMILLSVVCAIFVYAILWYIQYVENATIFEMIEDIDYSGVERQVVDKINGLLHETMENPGSADTWGKLGMNLYIHDYKDISVGAFQRAAEINMKDFRWPYFCAIALNELHSENTFEWFERSQTLNPHYPPLGVMLGNRYLIDGEYEQAERSFKLAITAYKRIPHAHLGLAKVAIKKSNLHEARAQLDSALELAPRYREAHAILADVYRRMGEKSKAEEEFEKIEKLPEGLDLVDSIYYQMVEEGESSFWCQVRANKYLQADQLDRAEEELKKALKAKPNAISFTSLGNVYHKQKRYNEAIEHYQAALKSDSNYVDALNNMAVVHFEMGNLDEAILLVKQSLNKNPESIDGHLNLGTFYKKKGDKVKAINSFQRGLQLAPQDMRFAYQLSWLYAAAPEVYVRNGKEALRLAEMVCEYSNYNTPASLDLLAVVLAENRQFRKAVEVAGRAYLLAVFSNKHQLAAEIQARQKLYKLDKPYRENN